MGNHGLGQPNDTVPIITKRVFVDRKAGIVDLVHVLVGAKQFDLGLGTQSVPIEALWARGPEPKSFEIVIGLV